MAEEATKTTASQPEPAKPAEVQAPGDPRTVVVDPTGAPGAVMVTLERGPVVEKTFTYENFDEAVERIARGCEMNAVTDVRVWMRGRGEEIAAGLEAKGFTVLRLQP